MRFCVLIILFLVHGVAYAQMTGRYIDSVFDSILMRTECYAVVADDSLFLDIYEPMHDTIPNRPVLLWVHGGGFAGGSRAHPDEVRLLKEFAQKGYVAVSMSYRLLRRGKQTGFGCDCPRKEKWITFRQAALDLLSAMKWLVQHHEAFGIDPEYIIVGGSSAGAETVLNATFAAMALDIQSSDNPHPAAVWSLAGAAVDISHLDTNLLVPTVLFHGTEDPLVPYGTASHHHCASDRPGHLLLDGSRTIADRLRELGGSYYMHTVESGGHEVCQVPFDHIDTVLRFFMKTLLKNQSIVQIEEYEMKPTN